MLTRKWSELMSKLPKERQERIRRSAKEESSRLDALELDLKAMRELLGKTQVEIAEALDISQAQVSDTEKREDWRLSTLRRYVEALGGKLELVASFGAKRIRLNAR